MSDAGAIWLTLRLALVSTIILLWLGIPLAWWLSRTRSRLKPFVSTIVSLPLVLPPTVLGFYLLIGLGPTGPIGRLTDFMGIGSLSFTFEGLVIGSVLYSLPFVVGPIQSAFDAIGPRPLEVAATLGAPPLARFFRVALPLARSGIVTGAVLGFAHTIGEFGVVLMIGGNIPGKTKVLSVAIYDHVEALDYSKAHALSFGMLLFSFLVLWFVNAKGKKTKVTL